MYFNRGYYYKIYEENIDFNTMINYLQNSHNDTDYVGYLDGIYVTVKEALNNESKFTLKEITRDNWKILIVDWDMIGKRDAVQDYLEDDLHIEFDSRYYVPSYMSIDDMWQYLDQHYPSLISDDILYDILMDLKNNKKLKAIK